MGKKSGKQEDKPGSRRRRKTGGNGGLESRLGFAELAEESEEVDSLLLWARECKAQLFLHIHAMTLLPAFRPWIIFSALFSCLGWEECGTSAWCAVGRSSAGKSRRLRGRVTMFLMPWPYLQPVARR